MDSLLELFVSVDDFCRQFLPLWERRLLSEGSKKRLRKEYEEPFSTDDR